MKQVVRFVALAGVLALAAVVPLSAPTSGSESVMFTSEGTGRVWKAPVYIPKELRTPQRTYRVKVTVTNAARCTFTRSSLSSRRLRMVCTKIPASGKVNLRIRDLRTGTVALHVHRFPAISPAPDPTTPPGIDTDYSFMMTQNDRVSPVRWDPCTGPLVTVTSGKASNPEIAHAVSTALERISEDSGLQVSVTGVTSFMPTQQNPDDGDPNTDIVVWAGARDDNALLGAHPDAAGLGGFSATSIDGGLLIPEHGYVVASAADLSDMPQGMRVRFFMHELGHVFGLGHVDDDTEVMFPIIQDDSTVFGGGDRAGLAAVGAPAGCVN